MQPAQLSLWPQEYPAPPETITPELPEDDLAAAIGVLADLIARHAAEPDAQGVVEGE